MNGWIDGTHKYLSFRLDSLTDWHTIKRMYFLPSDATTTRRVWIWTNQDIKSNRQSVFKLKWLHAYDTKHLETSFVVCCVLCGRKVRGRWAIESVTVSVIEIEKISISTTDVRISVAFSYGWLYRSPEHPSLSLHSFIPITSFFFLCSSFLHCFISSFSCLKQYQ